MIAAAAHYWSLWWLAAFLVVSLLLVICLGVAEVRVWTGIGILYGWLAAFALAAWWFA